MESDSMNLRSIIEEEEDEEEGNEASTVGSDKRLWNQSIQEMKDKENVCKYPHHNSDMSVSEIKASQSKKSTKKKGFNLRKSLAWNPAFFTEEGVLDPTELSFLSASHGKSNRPETPGNKHILNEAAGNSFSKSQMKSELRSHNGRKLFTTPEQSRRQVNKAPEGTRKLNQRGPFSKTLLRPPTMSQQKRVANMTATGHVPKVQKLMQGSITPTSQVSSNKRSVLRAVKGENSIGQKCLQLNQDKETVSLPKSSTDAENSAASQRNSQTIPKAPTNAPACVKPSGLRKPSPSFGFFAQGQIAAQSGSSSQTTTEKTLTTVPSSIPKPPIFKGRPPSGHDCAEKHTAGTFSQSKIPQIMRSDRTTVNITGKKCTKKSTRTLKEPREKLVASRLARNCISPEACSAKDPDTAICKSKDTSFTEKITTVSVEAKEPAMNQNLVQSKAFNQMDRHVTLSQPTIAMSSDDSSKKNQYKNSNKVAVQAEEPQAAQYTSNSISIEACSSTDENAVVSKSEDADLNVNTSGVKHVEENGICEGRETVSACVPMDLDVIISKSNDDDSKVGTNGMKHTQHSNTGCGGQEDAAVSPTSCSPIPPEIYSSKDKHITRHNSTVNDPSQGDISKVSVSPLKTRGKSDFSPCKEKLLEKRFKSDSGSSLTVRGQESYEDDNPGAGKVEENIADSSEGKNIPDLVPFSEEWLAALEAYGEEILEKKTGPVQNSPPDKTIPEPSPWSPVKKKVQDIGPYDCTKYSKTAPSSDSQ